MRVTTEGGGAARIRWTGSWLVCLDLQREYVVPGRPLYAPDSAAVTRACARVLQHARTLGWRVVHSQLRLSGVACFGADAFGAPIEGLRPLVSEPVFLRRSLSAFSDPEFAAELADARGEAVYLMGFSLADTCLATALSAIDQGLKLTLVEDAIGVGATAAFSAAEIARAILGPFSGSISSRNLAPTTLELAR